MRGILKQHGGRYRIEADTIYVDAPIALGFEFLKDLRNMDDWAHLLRADGEIEPESGEFRDEYNQKVKVTLRSHDLNNYYLIEQTYYYPDYDFTQRCPTIIIPCSYAFGDPNAQGFIQHRIIFWPVDQPLRHGKLQLQDFGAESMNVKRLLEAQAGNTETFARGMSYQPRRSRTGSLCVTGPPQTHPRAVNTSKPNPCISPYRGGSESGQIFNLPGHPNKTFSF